MSTAPSREPHTADRRTHLLVLALFWAVFGFLGDLRHRVNAPERGTLFTSVAAWVSVLFHFSGAAAAAFVSPTWGFVWALFAAGIAARRVTARKGIHISLWGWFAGKKVLAAGVTALVLTALNFIGWEATAIPAALAIVGFMVLVALRALDYREDVLSDEREHQRWVADLAPVFGVSPTVFEVSGIERDGVGCLIEPVPAAISIRFDRGAFDAALAQVHPHLQIAPASTAQRIVIDVASAETLARRSSLAASGGLLANTATPTTTSFTNVGDRFTITADELR